MVLVITQYPDDMGFHLNGAIVPAYISFQQDVRCTWIELLFLFDDAPSKTESGYGDANRCLRRTQNETWHQISMKDLCNRLNKYERFLQQTEQLSNLSCVSGWHSGIPHAPDILYLAFESS